MGVTAEWASLSCRCFLQSDTLFLFFEIREIRERLLEERERGKNYVN